MDMTTCDRISASSLFILSAIEATASEHSSWKGFNQIIEYADPPGWAPKAQS